MWTSSIFSDLSVTFGTPMQLKAFHVAHPTLVQSFIVILARYSFMCRIFTLGTSGSSTQFAYTDAFDSLSCIKDFSTICVGAEDQVLALSNQRCELKFLELFKAVFTDDFLNLFPGWKHLARVLRTLQIAMLILLSNHGLIIISEASCAKGMPALRQHLHFKFSLFRIILNITYAALKLL